MSLKVNGGEGFSLQQKNPNETIIILEQRYIRIAIAEKQHKSYQYISVLVNGILRNNYQGKRFLITESQNSNLIGLLCANTKYYEHWTAGRFLNWKKFEDEAKIHDPKILQLKIIKDLQKALAWQK